MKQLGICTANQCERLITKRRWCNKHYDRQLLYGDANIPDQRKANSHSFTAGNQPWNTGTKGIVQPNSGTFTRDSMAEDKHPQWKGQEAGYSAKHSWIKRHYGKASRCEECSVDGKRYTWANLDKKYTRDRDSWRELCYSCHKLYDIGLKELSCA